MWKRVEAKRHGYLVKGLVSMAVYGDKDTVVCRVVQGGEQGFIGDQDWLEVVSWVVVVLFRLKEFMWAKGLG